LAAKWSQAPGQLTIAAILHLLDWNWLLLLVLLAKSNSLSKIIGPCQIYLLLVLIYCQIVLTVRDRLLVRPADCNGPWNNLSGHPLINLIVSLV